MRNAADVVVSFVSGEEIEAYSLIMMTWLDKLAADITAPHQTDDYFLVDFGIILVIEVEFHLQHKTNLHFMTADDIASQSGFGNVQYKHLAAGSSLRQIDKISG